MRPPRGYKGTSGSDWFRMERAEAYEWPCGDCEQPAGQPCVNLRTGELLENFPAHPKRMTAARIARETARAQAEAEGRQP